MTPKGRVWTPDELKEYKVMSGIAHDRVPPIMKKINEAMLKGLASLTVEVALQSVPGHRDRDDNKLKDTETWNMAADDVLNEIRECGWSAFFKWNTNTLLGRTELIFSWKEKEYQSVDD